MIPMTHTCKVMLDTCALSLKRYYATSVYHEKADYLSAYTNWTYSLAEKLDISFLQAAEMAHNVIGKTLKM